jgi:hypothetical protein
MLFVDKLATLNLDALAEAHPRGGIGVDVPRGASDAFWQPAHTIRGTDGDDRVSVTFAGKQYKFNEDGTWGIESVYMVRINDRMVALLSED